MSAFNPEHAFRGRRVMVGFGCIGQGVLPLPLRHFEVRPDQVLVIAPGESGRDVARECGVPCLPLRVTPQNHRELLSPRLGPGDFLLKHCVDVSSAALIALCQARGALYLDTCIEPWAGGHLDPALPVSMRTNRASRCAGRTWARSLVPGATGRHRRGAIACTTKTSVTTIRGNSRTSG